MAFAVVRAVMAVVAIPLAPFLYREHVAILVFLRPTKETLLFAGFAIENHDASLPAIVVAALPILLAGVWLFYALGREFGPSLTKRDLPGVAGRVLPRNRIRAFSEAINERGLVVVFLARLAAMPSTLVAAAAGTAKFDVRRFLVVDCAGALVSLALMLGLGYVLDEAYEDAGPWLTAGGVLVIAGGAIVLGRAMGSTRTKSR